MEEGNLTNPHGNPGKDKLLRTALLMELKSKGEDMPELRQIARNCIDLALKSEAWAVKEIADRLDGKPAPTVTAETSEKRSEFDWTDDELLALLNERRASRERAA